MRYVSTRSENSERVSAAQAIKQGLASDGGLFMPLEIPKLEKEDFQKLADLDYSERAAYILSLFLSDYTEEELLAYCQEAYSENHFPGGAAPVVKVQENLSVLELWHGPTCAFKDMALQVMPLLLSGALEKTGEKRTVSILVATSGDTGKAALEGFKNVKGVNITVFYPTGGVSRIQKLQMATQEGNNVEVRAIKGNFDDAQNGVKAIFSDLDMGRELDSRGYVLSSANSINWGRLVPQIVYYVSAYCDMVKAGNVTDSVNVCVPSGNFGNILAGYIASLMGVPVNKFICASNKNNVLTDFINTGVYDRNRDFYTTVSPSMDILISSNLERLLYFLSGPDSTATYMDELKKQGKYEVSEAIKRAVSKKFAGYFCDEQETENAIQKVFNQNGYLIDTHTAVAMGCAEKYRQETGDSTPMLVVSTASPYKFASSVYKALVGECPEDEFEALEKLKTHTGVEIPAPIRDVLNKKVRFDRVIEADSMKLEVLDILK